jgi:hypothetical protein
LIDTSVLRLALAVVWLRVASIAFILRDAQGRCHEIVIGKDMKASHWVDTLMLMERLVSLRSSAMIWKLLGLQKVLDSLFDDAWISRLLPNDLCCDYEASEQLLPE